MSHLGMNSMAYYRSLSCGILILAFLALGEFGLNALRSILKGQAVLGDESVEERGNVLKPAKTGEFPFNSRSISKTEFNGTDLKIWVSSASHAADRHGTDNQFANLICSFLEVESCYVLNASRPGQLLKDNIEFIEANLSDWKPDYVLLYQAYLDIHRAAQLSSHVQAETGDLNEIENNQRVVEQIKESLNIEEFMKTLILRNHSRNYLGSSFLLMTPLLSDLPELERKKFENRLVRFVNEVRSKGSTPVLTTFASVHGNSKDNINWMYRTWLMRYFEGYSPITINRLIAEYNTSIRHVAEQYMVDVIDLDELWHASNRKGKFDDFVHFSVNGHQEVAKIIAEELKGIIR